MFICRAIEIVVETLFADYTIKSAVKYLAADMVVKVTNSNKPDRRETRRHIRLTIGKPNYAERLFVKKCKKAGEAFPVKKVQLRFYPKVKR